MNISTVCRHTFLLFCFSFLFWASPVISQEQKGDIIILSDKVGETIDPEERAEYKLFPGKGEFVEAVVLRFNDGSYGAKITYYENEKLETRIQKFPDGLTEVKKLKDYIEHFEEIQEGTYKLGEKKEVSLFREYHLNTKDLGSRKLDDINNDGLIDFVYINDRKLSFFLQTKDGFSENNSQTTIVDSSAVIFDIGDIDDKSPGKEIIVINPDGVFAYNQNESNKFQPNLLPIHLIKNASTLEIELNNNHKISNNESDNSITIRSSISTTRKRLRRWNLIDDINKDNLNDLIVPLDLGKYQFFIRNNNSSFNKSTTLSVVPNYRLHFAASNNNSRVITSVNASPSGVTVVSSGNSEAEGRSYSSSRIASVEKFYLEDYNGDKKPDIVFKRKKEDFYFLQNGDGTFSNILLKGKKIRFDKSKFRSEFRKNLREKYKKEKNLEISYPEFIDLNKDGIEDILCTKMSGGIFSLRSVLLIYYGTAPGQFPEKPSKVFVSEGIIAGDPDEICKDFNGDGRQDLVLPYFKISLTGIIKILITRNIKLKYQFYLCGEDGKYPEKPSFKRDINYKFSFSEDGEPTIAKFDGDFNGDGIKDMLIAPDRNKISIYYGNKTEVFPKKASVEYKNIRIPNNAKIADLNKDWKSDIYFRLSNNKKETEELVILLSN